MTTRTTWHPHVTIAESTAQPRQVWINAPKEIVVYTPPDYVPEQKTSTTIQEFRDRLTQAETDAILAASRTDVNIDRAIWLLSTQEDGLLHFDDQRVSSTLAYLVGKGLLAPERPAQLLA